MIRLERSNDRCDDFADFIEANSTLRVLRFYNTKRNKNKNKGNIRAQLQEIIDSGVYFVVLATGALRMADDLPRDVVYFFDYTHRTNYPSALRQGTPGRAGGHGKVSLVILSDINAQQVRDNDEENKSRFPKTNPSQHTTMGGRAAGLNNTLHRQARIPIRETSPIELCNKIVPFQDYLEAEAVRKFGDIPASLDWSVRFDTERGNKSGLLPPVEHFRDLLSMLEREFLATRPNVASVQFLGFDGDEITLEPDEVGPRFRYFDPRAPWSLRDRRKIDKSVRAMRAKAWRSKGGMVVQVVWDIVGPDGFTPAKVGTLRIVELIWPIKTIVDLSETSGTAAGYVPKPKGYTWQHKRYERAQA